MVSAKAAGNQMVPLCAEWRCETDNWATTPIVYCSSTASLRLRPHCANARQIRCQANLVSSPHPRRTGGDHQDVPVVCGWRLFSRTWNQWTCPWTKQSTWLRIVHSGDLCLRLALRTHSGACQKRTNERMCVCVCMCVADSCACVENFACSNCSPCHCDSAIPGTATAAAI